jgi:hypothetical protein
MTAVKNYRWIEWYLQEMRYYLFSTAIFVTVPEDVDNIRASSKFTPEKFGLTIVVVLVLIFAIWLFLF